MSTLTLKVNGQSHSLDVDPDTPLLYVLGARRPNDAVRLVNDRIEHGSLGMTSVVFEPQAVRAAA